MAPSEYANANERLDAYLFGFGQLVQAGRFLFCQSDKDLLVPNRQLPADLRRESCLTFAPSLGLFELAQGFDSWDEPVLPGRFGRSGGTGSSGRAGVKGWTSMSMRVRTGSGWMSSSRPSGNT
jgi:hypothetical protein